MIKINKFIFWISALCLIVIVILSDLQSIYGPGTTIVQRITSAFYKNIFGISILVIASLSGVIDLVFKVKNRKNYE